MGCQWAALYYPILWSALYFIFFILLIPKALLIYSKKQYTCRSFIANKGFINGIAWVLQVLCRVPIVWYGILGYILHLILLPWFIGQVFTDGKDRGYMTYMGWVVKVLMEGKNMSMLDLQILWWWFFPISSLWFCLLFWSLELWLMKERSVGNTFYCVQERKKMIMIGKKMSFLLYGYQGIEN